MAAPQLKPLIVTGAPGQSSSTQRRSSAASCMIA